MRVLSADGEPIVIDEEITAFTISQNGEIIAVNADGTAEQTGIYIGVVRVTNPAGLEKMGGNLYRVTPNANPDGEFEFGAAGDPDSERVRSLPASWKCPTWT